MVHIQKQAFYIADTNISPRKYFRKVFRAFEFFVLLIIRYQIDNKHIIKFYLTRKLVFTVTFAHDIAQFVKYFPNRLKMLMSQLTLQFRSRKRLFGACQKVYGDKPVTKRQFTVFHHCSAA